VNYFRAGREKSDGQTHRGKLVGCKSRRCRDLSAGSTWPGTEAEKKVEEGQRPMKAQRWRQREMLDFESVSQVPEKTWFDFLLLFHNR
jgi:hypothetical protein